MNKWKLKKYTSQHTIYISDIQYNINYYIIIKKLYLQDILLFNKLCKLKHIYIQKN